jgi:hypothetical protein
MTRTENLRKDLHSLLIKKMEGKRIREMTWLGIKGIDVNKASVSWKTLTVTRNYDIRGICTHSSVNENNRYGKNIILLRVKEVNEKLNRNENGVKSNKMVFSVKVARKGFLWTCARAKDDDVCPVFRYLQNQNFVPQNFIFNLE